MNVPGKLARVFLRPAVAAEEGCVVLFSAKLRCWAATAAVLMMSVVPASAGTITTGVAVSGFFATGHAVGLTEFRPILNGNAIKYFVPLGDGSGTYGVGSACSGTGFGTCIDTGNGGGTLTMILRFSPVSTSAPSKLSILFEDLDLKHANDPTGFFESLEVLKETKTNTLVSLTGLITDIGGLITPYGPGPNPDPHNALQLNYSIGVLDTNPLYLELKFKADFGYEYGTNTPEYLIATVTDIPTSPVPLAPMPLSATLLLSLGGWYAWRRRQLAA
jgi:hypothetical protein